ncbi:unnamed protein product [Arctogadus glacialis]
MRPTILSFRFYSAGLQPQPMFVYLPLRRPALPPQLLPPPVFLPPPALPQARSTLYKRKKTELGATRPQSTVQTHTLWPVHSRTHQIQEENILSEIEIIHIQRPHWKAF